MKNIKMDIRSKIIFVFYYDTLKAAASWALYPEIRQWSSVFLFITILHSIATFFGGERVWYKSKYSLSNKICDLRYLSSFWFVYRHHIPQSGCILWGHHGIFAESFQLSACSCGRTHRLWLRNSNLATKFGHRACLSNTILLQKHGCGKKIFWIFCRLDNKILRPTMSAKRAILLYPY